MSALTYSTDVTDTNPITGVAPETAAPGDDLTIEANVSVESTADVTLRAGDNVFIHGLARSTGTDRTLSITAGDDDLDGIGMLTMDGDVGVRTVQLAARQ